MILPVFLFTFLLANGEASAKRMGVDIFIDLEDSGDVEETSSYGWMQRNPTFSDRNRFGIGTQGQLTNLLCDHYDDLCGDGPYIPIAAYLTENELDDRWEKEFDKVGLPNVQFHMSAIEVEVLDSAAKPTVVKRSEMKNSSSKTITVNTGITSQQEETRTTSWSETHGFEIGQSFNVGTSKFCWEVEHLKIYVLNTMVYLNFDIVWHQAPWQRWRRRNYFYFQHRMVGG